MKKLIFLSMLSVTILSSCGDGDTLQQDAEMYADKYCGSVSFSNSLAEKQDVTSEEQMRAKELAHIFDEYSKRMEEKYAEGEDGAKFMEIARKKMAECRAGE